MGRYFPFTILSLLASIALHAQGLNSVAQSTAQGRVTVVKVGPGIEPPTLIANDFSAVISANCARKLSGKAELSLVVDSTGKPQNISFIKPATTDIDRLAVAVAQIDRFTPARQGQNPIATGASLQLQLHGCLVGSTNGAGQKNYRLVLASLPTQKLKPYNQFPPEVVFATESLPPDARSNPESRKFRVGGTVSAPIPMNRPDAEYVIGSDGKRITGECMISLFVDNFGLPQFPTVVLPLEPHADQNAIEAVSRYRFKPAMRDGMEPVPVLVTIAVNFR